MKTIKLIIPSIALLITMSCVDKSKEEARIQEELQTVETIDSTVQAINDSIKVDVAELEEALEELDSL
ncbi:hypothetical protein [Aegicerativicinus sediminis]|uniref:hypothetical protein n=1 Tax=Aegicerativicinus sediminis TaxID=2893202 RepID=UPI001E55021C|nr:hypothetical protein [Aegicerativicinus sediminis]